MRTLQAKAPQTIRAYVRIKPLLNGGNSVVQNTEHEVFTPRFTQDNFSFNEVFCSDRKNDQVFSTTMKPIVQHIFDGYNACVLAYGQTSTGKTHTMKGSESDRGLIPRTIRQIFTRIKNQNIVAKVRISYFQIYNQNIIDLLNSDHPPRYLDIRDDAKKNAVIMDIVEMEVSNQQDSLDYYDRGQARRKFASNNINFQSSRSHTIFRITLEVANQDVSRSTSVIDMVDLAGSESISKTNASGLLKKQSQNINRSLLALSNVIRSLSELYDKDKRIEHFEGKYINFRDSKLTRILQPCLTGNSKTIVICTIQQLEECIGETINTLKFGVAANSIKINASKKITTNPTTRDPRYEDLLATLQQERAGRRKVQDELIRLKSFYEKENIELKKKVNQLATQLLLQQTQNVNSSVLINQLKGQKIKHNENKQGAVAQLEDSIQLHKAENARLQKNNQELKMKYQYIKKHNQLLQKNQRVLIDKLGKYERELAALNQSLNKKEHEYRYNLESKQMVIEKENTYNNSKNHDRERQKRKPETGKFRDNPYTISRIIQLSSRILDMKMQIDQYTKSNIELQEENQKLVATIETLKNHTYRQDTEKEEKVKDSRASGNSRGQRNSGSRMGEWQIRNMKQQMKNLRAQKALLKKKIVQMRNTLKSSANNHIEQLHGFNRFIDKNFSEKQKQYFQFLFNESVQQFAPIPFEDPPTNSYQEE